MGNGTKIIKSGHVTALYQRVCRSVPLYRHYTINQRYMVAVVGEPRQIMIYDFARSVKPLMRVVDAGERVLLRDFWNLDEGINILQHLDRICANQRKQADNKPDQGVCAEEFKGNLFVPDHQDVYGGESVLKDLVNNHLVGQINTVAAKTWSGLCLNPQGQVVMGSSPTPCETEPSEAK